MIHLLQEKGHTIVSTAIARAPGNMSCCGQRMLAALAQRLGSLGGGLSRPLYLTYLFGAGLGRLLHLTDLPGGGLGCPIICCAMGYHDCQS